MQIARKILGVKRKEEEEERITNQELEVGGSSGRKIQSAKTKGT